MGVNYKFQSNKRKKIFLPITENVKYILPDYVILISKLIVTNKKLNYGIFRPQWRK